MSAHSHSHLLVGCAAVYRMRAHACHDAAGCVCTDTTVTVDMLTPVCFASAQVLALAAHADAGDTKLDQLEHYVMFTRHHVELAQ